MSPGVAQWIKTGVQLPWRCRPRPKTLPQKKLSATEEEFLDQSVKEMLEAGAIYQTNRKDLVLSSIYTVPKKDSGKRRPVINLRWVNDHLNERHFKMSTMKDVKASITQGAWMAKTLELLSVVDARNKSGENRQQWNQIYYDIIINKYGVPGENRQQWNLNYLPQSRT